MPLSSASNNSNHTLALDKSYTDDASNLVACASHEKPGSDLNSVNSNQNEIHDCLGSYEKNELCNTNQRIRLHQFVDKETHKIKESGPKNKKDGNSIKKNPKQKKRGRAEFKYIHDNQQRAQTKHRRSLTVLNKVIFVLFLHFF